MNAGKLLGQLHSSFCPFAHSPHKPTPLETPPRGRRGGSTPLRLWAVKCGDGPGRLGTSGANRCAPDSPQQPSRLRVAVAFATVTPRGGLVSPQTIRANFSPEGPSKSQSCIFSFFSPVRLATVSATMGFVGKKDPSEDGIHRAPSDQDVEKTVPDHQESGHVQPGTMTSTAIDPELERRVLRKLDWHVPTLMAFFCRS
jgi:hypothetical protein